MLHKSRLPPHSARLEKLAIDKCSNLFGLLVSDEDDSFITTPAPGSKPTKQSTRTEEPTLGLSKNQLLLINLSAKLQFATEQLEKDGVF